MRRPDRMDAAVRAWTTPVGGHKPPLRRQFDDPGPSTWSLIFDTETLTDLSQRLRVGAYQVRRGSGLTEEGLFFDEEALTAGESDVLIDYAAEHGLRLLTHEEFIEEVFFTVVVDRRGLLVGFNLPFDISRVAIDHHATSGRTPSMRGGFTFIFDRSEYRPRMQVKKVGPRQTFFRLTVPKPSQREQRNRRRGGRVANHRGYVVDVATLAAALLGYKGGLGGLAQLLDTNVAKGEEAHGEALTWEYLDYARGDVQVTWECFTRLRERYDAYKLRKPIHGVYSEASIAKAHLEEMGVRPWRECQPDVPHWLVAAILESYYGGRAECGVRMVPVPGILVDFTSQYPTVFTLMGLSRYLTATGITWTEEHPAAVQALLDKITVEDVLRPETWRQLDAIVLIDPEGARLPTRARYQAGAPPGGKARSPRAFNVALADRADHTHHWHTLADAITSKLETGRAPRILRVIRFTPKRRQAGLRAIDVAGDPAFHVDPKRDDIVRTLVELRATATHKADCARNDGDDTEAQRLKSLAIATKVAANSIAYGAPIEMNVTEHARPQPVEVHLPNGDSYQTKVLRTEQPGRYFHPLLATLVAGAGRLLLATAMRLVRDAGGTHAFCDTDSLFILATQHGGPLPDLTATQVEGQQIPEALSHAQGANHRRSVQLPQPLRPDAHSRVDPQNRKDQPRRERPSQP